MTDDTTATTADAPPLTIDDRLTSVFFSRDRQQRVRVADDGLYLVVSMPIDETNDLWRQVKLEPREILQLVLHVLSMPTLIEELGVLSVVRASALTSKSTDGDIVDRGDFEAVLREIVEVGTRRSVERVGDMYDMVNGYEDRVQVSEEARLAAEALGIEIEED